MAVDKDTLARLSGRLAGTVLGALHNRSGSFTVEPGFEFDGDVDANPRIMVSVNGVRFRIAIDLDISTGDECTCGHARGHHIYGEGPCRTGIVVCECEGFVLERQFVREPR